MNFDIILIIITLTLLMILGIQQYHKMYYNVPPHINLHKKYPKKGILKNTKKINKYKKKVQFRI